MRLNTQICLLLLIGFASNDELTDEYRSTALLCMALIKEIYLGSDNKKKDLAELFTLYSSLTDSLTYLTGMINELNEEQ